MGRRSYDLEVFVRYDGNLYFQDDQVAPEDLESVLRERMTDDERAQVFKWAASNPEAWNSIISQYAGG